MRYDAWDEYGRKLVCHMMPHTELVQTPNAGSVWALIWVSDIGIRVGAYVNAEGDLVHMTMASEAGPAIVVGHGASPNFQVVRELDRVLMWGATSRDDAVVVSCKAWLDGLKGHWRREGMHEDWMDGAIGSGSTPRVTPPTSRTCWCSPKGR
jgi:hypothetical protein